MSEMNHTEDMVYDFICKNPGMNTYTVSNKLKMTGGRVRHALSKLKEAGLIEFKFVRQSPRIQKLSYPVSAFRLLPRSLRKELGNI